MAKLPCTFLTARGVWTILVRGGHRNQSRVGSLPREIECCRVPVSHQNERVGLRVYFVKFHPVSRVNLHPREEKYRVWKVLHFK